MNPEQLQLEVRVLGRLIGTSTASEHMKLVQRAIRDGVITQDEAEKEVELRLVHENK